LKKIFYLLISTWLVLGQWAAAQQRKPAATTDPDDDDYASVTTYGITTNTNSGILGGFVVRHSKRLPNELFGKRQYRYLAIEAVNVKHPKEITEPSNSGARFTPGKENYLFVVRPQYGREFVLSNRNADEGISINGIVAVGPSIGIVKPYFVQFQSRPGQSSTLPYNPSSVPIGSNILGSGGMFQGFDQASIVPGVNLKMAVSFELSTFRSNSTGLEIGFLAEAFTKKIVIMSLADNYNVFTSGYITLFFGNKK
jgi:hypothetical protein